ncbi:MAG: CCA tRNA nucleotidyltransferase [Acidobacteria bacterium]|nr:CCA tRNA nucleotidyltransferase [Acidobacteriota bacterium]
MPEAEVLLRSDPVLVSVSRIVIDSEVWVAGGWIRDRLLGLHPAELDLAVPGDAGQAQPLAERLGEAFHATPHLLGRPPHSVWRLEGPELKVEIWPRGTLTVAEDCRRRDFTCNALQWRLPGGPLEDPTGGRADLKRRILRAVSRDNLRADPVRLLRAPRFIAQLPRFRIDPTTAGWIRELAGELAGAPPERIGQELLRMATAPFPARGLHLLGTLGLLPAIPPGTQRRRRSPLPILAASAHWLAAPRCPLPRWGVPAAQLQAARLGTFLAGWTDDGTRLETFAWPRDLREDAVRAVAWLPRALLAVDADPADRRELIARCGSSFPAALSLACATALATGRGLAPWRRWWRQWRRSGPHLVALSPLLRGDEVASILGRAPGPWLGELLEELQTAQIRREVRTRAGARRWLRRFPARFGMMPKSE